MRMNKSVQKISLLPGPDLEEENTGFVGFTRVFERYLALFVVDELNLVFFEAMLAALALE